MIFHLLTERIDKDSTRAVLDFLNTGGELTLAMDSQGGIKAFADLMLHALNQNKDRVTIIVLAGVGSCGFDIFYGFQGVRKLTFGCMGMTHYSSRSIDIHPNGAAAYTEGVCHKKNLKAYKDRELEVLGQFATPSEITQFKKGWDVYFSFERMKEIFPEAEII
jgi:hypothetical protein